VLADGFAEAGPEGERREARLRNTFTRRRRKSVQ